jgi:hypothetical protein
LNIFPDILANETQNTLAQNITRNKIRTDM